ncbi:Uncharacterised protein [Candidatus Tiddalikarchaeum anstoanum]|nr:Uncharacterised protein [Candidatus Tiddalikarchaeum anstoanum]
MADQKKISPQEEAMRKAWSYEFNKPGNKTPGISKSVLTSIGLILISVFFIIPAIIGMVSSGYVNLSNPLAVGLGITIAVFIFIGSFYMPGMEKPTPSGQSGTDAKKEEEAKKKN